MKVAVAAPILLHKLTGPKTVGRGLKPAPTIVNLVPDCRIGTGSKGEGAGILACQVPHGPGVVTGQARMPAPRLHHCAFAVSRLFQEVANSLA